MMKKRNTEKEPIKSTYNEDQSPTILERLREKRKWLAPIMAVVALGVLSGKAYNAGKDMAEEKGQEYGIAEAWKATTTFTASRDTGNREEIFERVLVQDKNGNWNVKEQGVGDAAAGLLIGSSIVLGIGGLKRRMGLSSKEGSKKK